jgi:hypothetical protein
VNLQAFVDDSRSSVDGRNFVLAGYIHTAENWLKFSDDWKAALKETPSIEYFHMVEAENLRDQFKGWKEDERTEKVRRLGEVIYKHNPHSFECWVSKRAFNEILKPVAPYDLKNPYMVCFYGAIVSAARHQAMLDVTIPVDFVFDEQGGLGAFVVFWYEWIKQWQDPSISAVMGSTPIFRDDKKMLPLQAADFLAWHLRRRKESRYANEIRPAIKRIIGNHLEAEISEDVLRTLAKNMAATPGIDDTQLKKSSIRKLLKPNWEAMKTPIEGIEYEESNDEGK